MKRLLCILVLVALLPASALAVSFEITGYTMDIAVQPDGAGLIEQTIVYEFDGTYNGILTTIRHIDVGFDDLRLFVDDTTELTRVDALDETPFTYTAETIGDATSIKAYAPGDGGTRTFAIHYRMDGMALRYRDTARVNHMLLRAENAYESALFTLVLPESGAAGVDAFAHGALGAENISHWEKYISFGPVKVKEGQYAEIDVLFPAEWLSEAPLIDQDMREEALALEAALADELAEALAAKARLRRAFVIVAIALLFAYVLGMELLVNKQRRRYGVKSPVQPTTDPQLLAEIPPALAQVLLGKPVSAAALGATLLSLADRGVLKMQQAEEDTSFTLIHRPDGLSAHEEKLLDWLFAASDTLWIQEMNKGKDEKAAEAFVNQYDKWKQSITQDCQARGWRFPRGDEGMALAILLGLLAAGICFGAGVWPLGIIGAVWMIVYAVRFGRLRKLTDAGEARRDALYGFVQNYLDKLKAAAEAPLGSWAYLPLAMALGYMQPLADWAEQHPDGFEETGIGGYVPLWALLSMERRINEAQSHNNEIIQSDDSSSGGVGGSSGGAGGGSSHGAW
ncbi:MAG: DUF2207 domain-containing protein [Oscillospiraceae bacterium]|nr:DUF2207 domain-containing protein [Oscillospiraceae bacterium]